MITYRKQMEIGSRVRLTKEITLWNKTYSAGHEFTIVGNDNIRGFDLEDDNGNKVSETRFLLDEGGYELVIET